MKRKKFFTLARAFILLHREVVQIPLQAEADVLLVNGNRYHVPLIPGIGGIDDVVFVVIGADDVLIMVADPNRGNDPALADARGEVIGEFDLVQIDLRHHFRVFEGIAFLGLRIVDGPILVEPRAGDEAGDDAVKGIFSDDHLVVGIDEGIGIFVDRELLVHDLEVFLLHREGDGGGDFMVVGVAAKDFVFADPDDEFVMDAFEVFGGDHPVHDPLSGLADEDVFGADDDVDFLIEGEVVDAIPDGADETNLLRPHHGPVVNIGFADEVGDEGVDGFVVNLFRGADLLDDPVLHDDDAVGHGKGLFLIVGDVKECDAKLLVHFLQLDLHVLPHFVVEGGEGFVQKEDLRLIDDGAGDGDPLLLAAGKGGNVAVFHFVKVDDLKGAGDLFVDLLGRDALLLEFGLAVFVESLLPILPQHGDEAPLHLEPEGDVVVNVKMREKGIMLENRVDRPFISREGRDVHSVEQDLSA